MLDVALGIGVGSVLGVLYIVVVSPLLTYTQRTMGDYVPPGELLPTVSSAIRVFFVANVLLAPFVEESLYRGYAIFRLSERMSRMTTRHRRLPEVSTVSFQEGKHVLQHFQHPVHFDDMFAPPDNRGFRKKPWDRHSR